MPLRKNLDAGFEAWWEQLSGSDWQTLSQIRVDARVDGRFEQVGEFAYRLGKREYDFEPDLADEDCFGQPKDVSADYAFAYLFYRKFCAKAGIEPSAYVDFRYYVRADGPDPDDDFDLVDARDC